MAIRLIDRYPNRANPANTDYPHGSGRNKSSPTAIDGTPFDENRFNDQEGFFQSLLEAAEVTPNNTPDTVPASQYADALSVVANGLIVIDVAGNANATLDFNQKRVHGFRLTGILTGNIEVIVPDTERMYTVVNDTTGDFTVTVKTALGAGVVATQGQTFVVRCDGADVVRGLDSQRTIYVGSVAELEAVTAPPVDGSHYEVTGYNAGTDVGGGLFYWDASSTAAADGGTVFKATAITTGRFKRASTEVLSVFDFGWNNQPDATPILQNFFDVCSSLKSVGVLENGTYFSAPLTVPSNLRIVSRGQGIAKIQNLNEDTSGGSPGSLEILIANTKENISFKGIVFDGGQDFRDPANGPIQVHSLIDFTACSEIRFSDCVFTRHSTSPNTNKGILSFSQCSEVCIKNCDITKGTVEGLSFFGGSEIDIDGCYFFGINDSGQKFMSSGILLLESPENWSWRNCLIEDTAGSGSNNTGKHGRIVNNVLRRIGSNGIDSGEGSTTPNENFVISGNLIENFTKSGIYWVGTQAVISNNIIRDGDRGILLSGNTGASKSCATVTGNHIENVYFKRSGESNQGYGIFANGNTSVGEESNGIAISANTIEGTANAGILIRNFKRKIVVSNNVINTDSRGVWFPSQDSALESCSLTGNTIFTTSTAELLFFDSASTVVDYVVVTGNVLETAGIYETIINNSNFENKVKYINNTGRIFGKASCMIADASNLASQAERFPIQLGAHYLWVDDTGDLRIKNGAPLSATDGVVVGTQT